MSEFVSFTVSASKLDIPKHLKKVDNDKFWTFAANEWWRLITPYTPMDTGTLFESVDIRPKIIHYKAPYAARVYGGKHFNFRRDHHPLASAEWDKAAIPQQRDKLISSLQDYADKKL